PALPAGDVVRGAASFACRQAPPPRASVVSRGHAGGEGHGGTGALTAQMGCHRSWLPSDHLAVQRSHPARIRPVVRLRACRLLALVRAVPPAPTATNDPGI